jgi:hypothetical protein
MTVALFSTVLSDGWIEEECKHNNIDRFIPRTRDCLSTTAAAQYHTHSTMTACTSIKGEAKKDIMPELKEPLFWDCCTFSQQKMIDLANGTYEDRIQAAIPASKATAEVVLTETPLTWWEDVYVNE